MSGAPAANAPGSRPAASGPGPSAELLDCGYQFLFVRPVAGEVLVRRFHLVVVPPEHVDAEREDRGHDPAHVVVRALCLARIGSWQVLPEPAVDQGKLLPCTGFGLLVPDQ